MKFISKQQLGILTLSLAGVLTGCTNEPETPLNGASEGSTGDIRPLITLNISSLTTGYDARVTERITSLRIIILSETDGKTYVEWNKHIDLTAEGNYTGTSANTFNYIFSRSTVPGVKKFYLIANEETVNSVSFDDMDVPEWLETGGSLSDVLNHFGREYIPGYDDYQIYKDEEDYPEISEEQPKGEELLDIFSHIYFTPEYNIDNGNIKLLYSSYYEGFEIIDPRATRSSKWGGSHTRDENSEGLEIDISDLRPEDYQVDNNFYLVPCATKFYLEFVNYRINSLKINSAEIGGIADTNFIIPQLEDSEKEKLLGGKKVWWTDWLAAVSKASHSYPEYEPNIGFNSENGWISDFRVPADAYSLSEDPEPGKDSIGNEPEESEEIEIKGWRYFLEVSDNRTIGGYGTEDSNKSKPTVREYGPFYLPESHFLVPVKSQGSETEEETNSSGEIDEVDSESTDNIVEDPSEPEVRVMEQKYYLTMDLEDTGKEEDKKPNFTNVEIGNLNSMFRSTCLRIRVTMIDWNNAGAFAQIRPWNEHYTNGYLTEEKQ
ncbi:MAG: hypothetical protein J1F12_07250 [Muribaculaceae bacterium]|nr:hypothetical protein [Muribaculaceae bacterium]